MINNTKIQYISVADKIYKVTDIDFCNLAIEATETDLVINDVPENEVFTIEELREYRIRLVNGDGVAKIIDMAEWKKEHGMKE